MHQNAGSIAVIHSVSSWLPQTETWLYNQVRVLPRSVASYVICERTENLDQFAVPNIHSLCEASRWRYFWDKGLRKLRIRHHLGFLVQMARRHDAQVLHSHFGSIGWRNMEVAKRAALKHVVTFYGQDVSHFPTQDYRWRDRYWALFQQVDRVLCEGPHMGQKLVALGCPKEKLRIHRLGIRVDEIPFKPRRWTRGAPLRVLIAASFREKKGIPYALEALGSVQHETPLEITIVGDANADPRTHRERQRILATVAKHGLQAKVRMLGYQPHSILLGEAYDHHVFISPSVTACDGDTEGGAPVTLIEMAATGMPLLSTRHCDIPEVIRGDDMGLLANERDIGGLAEHLRWLIAHPDGWEGMARNARAHVEREFCAREQGEKLAKIYQEVLGSCGID